MSALTDRERQYLLATGNTEADTLSVANEIAIISGLLAAAQEKGQPSAITQLIDKLSSLKSTELNYLQKTKKLIPVSEVKSVMFSFYDALLQVIKDLPDFDERSDRLAVIVKQRCQQLSE